MSTIASLVAHKAQQRAEALPAYIENLGSEKPNLIVLAEQAAILGKSEAQVDADRAALLLVRASEARIAQEKAGVMEELTRTSAIAEEKRRQHVLELERLNGELAIAEANAAAALNARQELSELEREVRRVKGQHRDVFGLPPAGPAPEKRSNATPIQTIQTHGTIGAPSYEKGREARGPIHGENNIRNHGAH